MAQSLEGHSLAKKNKAKCKACGAEIIWATSPNDKRIPIELNPHVYILQEQNTQGELLAKTPEGMGVRALVGISHFLTCPAADSFTRGQRRPSNG